MNPYNPNINTSKNHPRSTHPSTTDTARYNDSKVTQCQPSKAEVRQELTNAQSLISETPSAHKKVMQKIIHAKTDTDDLIALGNTISDLKTQQRAWVIIANKANIPAHVRLEAALKIKHEQTRKTILEMIAKDPTINICIRIQAAQEINRNLKDNRLYQNLEREVLSDETRIQVFEITYGFYMPENAKLHEINMIAYKDDADVAFACITANPSCSHELRFHAFKKIQDKTIQQNACYASLLHLKNTTGYVFHKLEWLNYLTDASFMHFKDRYLLEMISHPNTVDPAKFEAAKLLSQEEGQKVFIQLYSSSKDSGSSLYGECDKLILLNYIKDAQFLKEQEPYLWNVIHNLSHHKTADKIKAAELISLEKQPQAFLYIIEHFLLNSDSLRKCFLHIPDESFFKEKKAILKKIIHDEKRDVDVKCTAVQLAGKPYAKNISTILSHPLQYPYEQSLNSCMQMIQLLDNEEQKKDFIFELLSNTQQIGTLSDKLMYTIHELQDPELKEKLFDKFVHCVHDPVFPKANIVHFLSQIHNHHPKSIRLIEWNASFAIECLQNMNPQNCNLFADIISSIPAEKRDNILEEFFTRVNLSTIENANYYLTTYAGLFERLYALSSEQAQETILFAIASNNNLENQFRTDLIKKLAADNEAKIRDLLEVIASSHEGTIHPKGKYTTKRAR